MDIIARLARDLRRPLTTATTEQLAAWLARPRWSRATRSTYRYHIQAYYAWLADVADLPVNPAGKLLRVRVPQRPPRPVSVQVLAEILARARNPYRRYILLASHEGLRCGEIAVLRTEHMTRELITVRGKGDKVRYVDTHPLVWAEICRMPPGRIWHLPHHHPDWVAHAVSNYCSVYLTKLGFEDVTMHMFRAYFATEVYRRTGNLRVVQELLGHASVATTQRYTSVSDEERRLAVHALPAVA